MKFGDNLKKIRKNKKLSQEQLAEKVNVSRQSVSKWENGEAYPEMNNILELCKIFNCRINDLVHPEMSDITSLDEDIIMNIVKFNEKKQKEIKFLSNIISLIGKIGKIVLMVFIPFILSFMILVPYVITNIEIKNEEITFKTNNIKLIDNNNLELFDKIILDIDELPKDEIINIFNNFSKSEIIGYIEGKFIFLLIYIFIIIIILNYIEKLFKNIKDNNTPFTLDNVKYIKRISYLMITLIMLMPLINMIFNYNINLKSEDNYFDLMSILEILIIFSMSYIFEYGYEIQTESNGIMYNE